MRKPVIQHFLDQSGQPYVSIALGWQVITMPLEEYQKRNKIEVNHGTETNK